MKARWDLIDAVLGRRGGAGEGCLRAEMGVGSSLEHEATAVTCSYGFGERGAYARSVVVKRLKYDLKPF